LEKLASSLALALTRFQTDSPAARSTALVGSGNYSGVGGFVEDQLAAGHHEGLVFLVLPVNDEKTGTTIAQ
jgi:hypothetical protein